MKNKKTSLPSGTWASAIRNLGCALLLGLPFAQAGLVSASDDTVLTNRAGGPFTVGFDFTVEADQVINALGVEDQDSDGLAIATQAGLWDITDGVSVELARVDIPDGETATLEDGFRYVAIGSEITLETGRTYRIGAVVSADNPFTDTADAGGGGEGFSGEGVTILFNRFAIGGDLAEPVNDGTLDAGRWAGGNATFLELDPGSDSDFQITDISINPETDTMTLIWNSQPGENYSIEFSQDMIDWSGIFAPSVDASAETQTSFTADRPGLSKLFFRVRVNE